MYSRYAERHRWQVEVLSSSPSDLGGFKEVIARIVGKGAYSKLKFESGGHRVQRVPETETQGRIHTSAATVAVMPEADEVADVELNPAELKVDTYPRLRRRRAARQQDRLGGAHDASADRDRGRVPGRPLAAQEPGAGARAARAPASRTQQEREQQREGGGDAEIARRLRRPLRAHPHLQLPAGPRHRPPHQARRSTGSPRSWTATSTRSSTRSPPSTRPSSWRRSRRRDAVTARLSAAAIRRRLDPRRERPAAARSAGARGARARTLARAHCSPTCQRVARRRDGARDRAAVPAAPRRRAGRLPHRRARVLRALAQGHARRADPAARRPSSSSSSRSSGCRTAPAACSTSAPARARSRSRSRTPRPTRRWSRSTRRAPRSRSRARTPRRHGAAIRFVRGRVVRRARAASASTSWSRTRRTSPPATRTSARAICASSRAPRSSAAPTGSTRSGRSSPARRRHLVPGGWLLFEHGFDQAERCRSLLGDVRLRGDRELAGSRGDRARRRRARAVTGALQPKQKRTIESSTTSAP